ncbi:hypothetical protein NKH84_32690 [Mesorhizobium sp. M0902]|uniref:hypothetical protein n=1 Tax=unclassified Mesorhizobium TaxID=325217 RepID=UPI00333D6E30
MKAIERKSASLDPPLVMPDASNSLTTATRLPNCALLPEVDMVASLGATAMKTPQVDKKNKDRHDNPEPSLAVS